MYYAAIISKYQKVSMRLISGGRVTYSSALNLVVSRFRNRPTWKSEWVFPILHLYKYNFANNITKSKTASDLKSFALPKKIICWFSFMFTIFTHFSFTHCSNVSQKCCITSHVQNRCWRLSACCLQKLYLSPFVIFIYFSNIFVARILWVKRIWNHFNFTSCICWILLKVAFQLTCHNYCSRNVDNQCNQA